MLSEAERAARWEKLANTKEEPDASVEILNRMDAAVEAMAGIVEAVAGLQPPEAADYGPVFETMMAAIKAIKPGAVVDNRAEIKAFTAALDVLSKRETKATAGHDYSPLIKELIASVAENTAAVKEQTGAMLRPKILTFDKDGEPNGIKPDRMN